MPQAVACCGMADQGNHCSTSEGSDESGRQTRGQSGLHHRVVGLMRTLALELAPHFIRVNSVHPTGVNTDMIQNAATYRLFRPDLENPTADDMVEAAQALNALPIPWVEPRDISNAVLFLASDEARYITGVTLPVDAGSTQK
jgi:NAD(P)-dependent dehydrogenase (short-subunit alcohol dehydrogenase family)